MSFEYLREQYDVFNDELLQSSFSIVATLNIHYDEVLNESVSEFADGDLTSVSDEPIKRNYPIDLNSFYRVQVFPIEKSALTKGGTQISYGIQGRFDPYDRWISCFKDDVAARGNMTLFDYADTVMIQGTNYTIKGVIQDTFGNREILHVFLVKEYDE